MAPAAVAKPKAPKVAKEKKAAVVKKPRAHPPYADVCKFINNCCNCLCA